jgi:hypothetical protein
MKGLAIAVDTREIDRGLRELKRQIPYATARALTMLAKDAQALVREKLSEDFTIRTTRVGKGIVTEMATKRRLVAMVGSLDKYMAQQALGATLTGKEAGAVPRVGKGLGRPTKRSKTLPSKWIGARLEKAEAKSEGSPIKRRKGKHSRRRLPFFVTFPGGRRGLVKRKGKDRLPLETIYTMPGRIRIPVRWPIGGRVRRAVAEKHALRVAMAMEQAVRTAHSKSGGWKQSIRTW